MAVALGQRPGGDTMEFFQQVTAFAATIVTGAFLGIIFDFYRVLSRSLRLRPVFTSVSDLLFWGVATIIIFITLLASNWGEVRMYVFIGLISGALLYFRLMSGLVTKGLYRIFLLIGFISCWAKIIIVTIIVKPAGFCMHMLSRPFMYTQRKSTAWLKNWLRKPPDEMIPPKQ